MQPIALRREIRLALEQAGIESAEFESRVLLEQLLQLPPGAPLPETPLTEPQIQLLRQQTARRCQREPLQYLCGCWEFYGLPFAVGPGVLIPRQDTETLVDTVLELRAGEPATRLLDLCSGTGCIPAAVCAHLPHVTGFALELSADAVPYLRQNLERHAPWLKWLQGDALHPPAELLAARFDVITCNPPYLTGEDMTQLQPEVAKEPPLALYGGADGLDYYRQLTPLWKSALVPGGWLVYEVGEGQAAAVKDCMEHHGFQDCRIAADLTGKGRVTAGRLITGSPLGEPAAR